MERPSNASTSGLFCNYIRLFPGSGDGDSPAGGPDAGVPRAPLGSFPGRGDAWCWSEGAYWDADALPGTHDVSGPAQGQLAWTFSWRWRPPRVSRTAVCRMRYCSVFGSAVARGPSRAAPLLGFAVSQPPAGRSYTVGRSLRERTRRGDVVKARVAGLGHGGLAMRRVLAGFTPIRCLSDGADRCAHHRACICGPVSFLTATAR